MVNLSTPRKSGRKKVAGRSSAPPGAAAAVAAVSLRRSDIHPLDRAIAELRAELAKNPDEATLLGRLGALYYRRGDLQDAEAHYRKAIKLAPERPSLHNNLGNVLCDSGRMRDGIGCYEYAMSLEKSLHPDREPSAEATANLELARLEYRLIHERIEYFERASQLDVSSDQTLNSLGAAYLLRGSGEKALSVFRKAARLNPRNAFAGLNIAFTHTLSLEGPTDLKTALADIAEALMRFPHEARLHLHQGELLEAGGLLEAAEDRYLRAVKADARCLEAYDLLGRLREATGFLNAKDEVAQTVTQALQQLETSAKAQQAKQSSAALPLYDLACVEVARARFTRTRLTQYPAVDALLREAIAADQPAQNSKSAARPPFSVSARAAVLRAQLLQADGRADEARLILENACTLVPNEPKVWFERGSLALRSGDIANAVEYYERCTIVCPQDALPCHSLRFAFDGYRRYRSERVRFETTTKAHPRDALAYHHLALAALTVLKDEEALFHFTRALELDPRLSDAACGRGRALQRLGHLAEAEAAYSQALAIDPENAEAQRSLVGLRSQKLLGTK